METAKREGLENAYKKEKDPKVAARVLAVHTVHVREKSIAETGADLMRSDKWAYNWLKRFDAGGLGGSGIFSEAANPCRLAAERIIRLHTSVPPGSKVVKCGSLECGTIPNRSGLSMASVPIYRTIAR